MSLTAQPFTFYAGDTTSLTVALLKDGSAFTPGTAYNLIFTAKRNLLDEDRSALFQYSTGIGVTHSTTNAVVAIHPIDTRYLGGKTLQFDIKAQDLSTGDVVATVAIGTLVVTKNVGRLTTTSVAIHTAAAGAPYGVAATTMAGVITAASTITPITGDEIAPALSGGVLGKFTYSAIKAWMLDGISSAWEGITGKPAFGGASLLEVGTTAGTVAAGDHNHSGVYQPADANIVSVSTPADNDFIQRVSGSWVTRTIAQVKTALGLGTAAYTASTDYATALGADDNYVTDAQKAALHAAATVTGNGIAITGQVLSLSIGTGATEVAAGDHSHAWLDSATDAATADTLVRRGSVGQASFASDSSATALSAANSGSGIGANITSGSGIAATIESTSGIGADIYSISGTAAYITSGSGIGANIYSTSGPYAAYISNLGSGMGADIRSYSGTGAGITSESGTYHATFGLGGNDRAFVTRLLGAFGWWRGAYTLMVSAVDTLTADRVQRFPDKDGTVAMTSDITGTNSGTNTGDQNLSGLAVKSANLSDLASASAARTNLGLGTAATTATTAYATALGADDNYVTDAQKAALHAAATVSGNGIALTGQQISLSIGTGATEVAAGDHSHASLDSATDAATADTLVKRGSVGQASFAGDFTTTALIAAGGAGLGARIESSSSVGAEIVTQTGFAAADIYHRGFGIGANIASASGIGASITSASGIGASITSTSSIGADIYSYSGMGADIRSYSGVGARISTEGSSAAAGEIYHYGSGIGATIGSFNGDHLNVGSGQLVVANNGDTTLTGLLIAKAVTVTPNTVAALTGGVGTIAYVNNADTPVIGSSVVGGASAKCLVCYNGTSWIVTSLL